MRLQRLIIQGFKSFKDRSIIHFDQGITGIVGPNGCGKSNIVDALFWVMGEQSAKHLRGSSMQDLIFNGSSKYNPSSFAEASLVLDNEEGKHIHIGDKVQAPREIKLTRKLYRNGESEYRINNSPCRLRDIQEVFMDTGAGAKSYSIIAQGEINRLVQAKPEERRSMIEEVAGITKFKARRKESLRKMEQTQFNLGRLNDLKVEVKKGLDKLKAQSEKAVKARTLREKIEKLELSVEGHKEFDLLREIRALLAKNSELQLERENIELDKDRLELSLETERIEQTEKEEELEKIQGQYNTLSKELAILEERQKQEERSLGEKLRRREEIDREIIEAESELEERKEAKEKTEILFQDLLESGKTKDNIESERQELANLKEILSSERDQFGRAKEYLREQRNRDYQLNLESAKNHSHEEDLAAKIDDISTQIEALELDLGDFQKKRPILLAEQEKKKEELERTGEELKKLAFSLKEKKEEQKKSIEELQRRREELLLIEGEIQGLKSLISKRIGVDENLNNFLKAAPSIELVEEKIATDKEHVPALELILEELSLATGAPLITPFQNALKNFDSFFHMSRENKISNKIYLFSPSSDKAPSKPSPSGFIPLSHLLRHEDAEQSEEEKTAIDALFSGIYLTQNIDRKLLEELRAPKASFPYRLIVEVSGEKAVRREGEQLSLVFLAKENKKNREESILSRKIKLSELQAIAKKKRTNLKEEEERFSLNAKRLKEEEGPLEEKEERLSILRRAFKEESSDLEAKIRESENILNRLGPLNERKKKLSLERFSLIEGREKIEKEKNELLSELSKRENSLKEEEGKLHQREQEYQEKKEGLSAIELKLASFARDKKSFELQLADIEKSLERISAKKLGLSKNRAEIEAEIIQLSGKKEGQEKTAAELIERLSLISTELREARSDLEFLISQKYDREESLKKHNSSLAKLNRELLENELKLGQKVSEEEQVLRNTFEKYRVRLRDLVKEELFKGEEVSLNESFSDLERHLKNLDDVYREDRSAGTREKGEFHFVRKYGKELAAQSEKLKLAKLELRDLGDINWQAIEEYERQEIRFQFLAEQEKELEQSLSDLQKAVEHIDNKSKERFKEAFKDVDERFQKVFPLIFGGGEARLKLIGELEDADCGVDIIARPPGKKMQHLGLMSGGEKALTAVSLIFSIFLVRPSPFCLLDEVDAPLDDANVGRFNELLREMSSESQFILITHNKKTMELNDTLYGVTMGEPGVSQAVSIQVH